MKLYQKIAGLNCYCDIQGKGRPLILIHGWGQSHRFWQDFYQRFHKNYVIYSFDLPGFGLSEAPKVVWGVADYSNFLKEFIQHFKLKSYFIIGHSFGGRIAVYYCSQNKDAKKLILYSASGIANKTSIRKNFLYFLLPFLTLISPKTIYYLQCTLFKSKTYVNRFINTNTRAKIIAGIYIKTHKLDLTNYAQKISIPTLLVYGEKDKIVPVPVGYQYKDLIKHSQLNIIPNTGHFSHIEASETFFDCCCNFIENE